MPAPIPSSLIKHPCQPVGAGDTVKSLQKGYIENLYCIGKYKGVVNSIESYNQNIEGLRDDN